MKMTPVYLYYRFTMVQICALRATISGRAFATNYKNLLKKKTTKKHTFARINDLDFKILGLSIISILSVHDESYSRNASCTVN